MKKWILRHLKWWIAGKELQEKNAQIALLKEELRDAKEFAFESGLDAARDGPHTLFVHEDSDLDGLEGDAPFCHFYFYSDSGDSSVGIPGRCYWALSDDQTGTELARVLDMRNIKAKEWIDIALLALDGACRTGATSEAIAAGLCGKLTENELRTWPDWRTANPDKAIEHIKGEAK